ncbi:MAG: dihydrolipoamide acetyltransferase family protein [Solirubrobacterales bacterium]
MADVVMPRLSDSMEEGTVIKWLKSVGDELAVGDELVEIETDKANMVYEADTAGTLSEIVAQEGETLPIGEVIARVGGGAGGGGDGAGARAAGNGDASSPAAPGGTSATPPRAPQAAAPGREAEEAAVDAEPATPTTPEPAVAAGPPETGQAPQPAGAKTEAVVPETARRDGDGGRVKASPIARRIAQERGVDIATLSGSGPGGRVVKADVEKALAHGATGATAAPATPGGASAASAPASRPRTPGREAEDVRVGGDVETAKGSTEVVELTRLQQTVARRMAESKATAPHFFLQAEIDMSAAVAGRKALKASAAEGEPVPTFNDMVVKACGIALREFPRANGAYRDGRVELYSRVNVGVAVAAQDALVVPTIFDADLKGLRQISAETRALAAKVRDGTIIPPELSGGTFTVSNLGMYGVSNFQAVINTPQAAILSVGELKAKPVVLDGGEIAARELMGVTLACDHRILYGADGAQFLARVRGLLESPLGLAL